MDQGPHWTDWLSPWLNFYTLLYGVGVILLLQAKHVWRFLKFIWRIIPSPFSTLERGLSGISTSIDTWRVDVKGDLQELRMAIQHISLVAEDALAKTKVLLQLDEVAYFECNMEGSCIWTNQALQDLFELPYTETLGYGWLRSLHPDDMEPVRDRWLLTIAKWHPYRARYRLLLDGVETLVEATAEVIKSTDGVPLCILGKIAKVPVAPR